MDLNEALRRFDLVEANVAKLEGVWTKMEKLIPDSVAFVGSSPEGREYRLLMRDFSVLVESLPPIDGWKITARPSDLNDIAQERFDALDIGEISAQVAVEGAVHAPREQIDEYRHRLSRKRHQLVHARSRSLSAKLTLRSLKQSRLRVSFHETIAAAPEPQLSTGSNGSSARLIEFWADRREVERGSDCDVTLPSHKV